MGEWVDQVHARAAILLDQLTSSRKLATSHGLVAEDAAKPYLEMIQKLYEDELQWASMMDSSDLIIRMSGPAVDRETPILSSVSDAFIDIGKQVGRVTRAIIGLAPDDKRGRKDIELALSGLARGSLVVGVRVVRPSEAAPGKTTLFGEDDPLYRSVREAVRQIAVVTQHASEDGIDDELRHVIPDPAVRDALTVAAQQLAPTGRKGVNIVEMYSPGATGPVRSLTPLVRRAIGVSLRRPVKSTRRGTFEGVVREIDLDARRFELRRVRGAGAVRCVYPEEMSGRAERWLNKKLKVSGTVELGPGGEARLVQVGNARRVSEPSTRQQKLALARHK